MMEFDFQNLFSNSGIGWIGDMRLYRIAPGYFHANPLVDFLIQIGSLCCIISNFMAWCCGQTSSANWDHPKGWQHITKMGRKLQTTDPSILFPIKFVMISPETHTVRPETMPSPVKAEGIWPAAPCVLDLGCLVVTLPVYNQTKAGSVAKASQLWLETMVFLNKKGTPTWMPYQENRACCLIRSGCSCGEGFQLQPQLSYWRVLVLYVIIFPKPNDNNFGCNYWLK